MDSHKICFIACVNDEQYERELVRYISNLVVPDGYSIDYLSIWEASSMCAGYNEGMQASDAKYKVYLHQDTFIVNPLFVHEILKVFADDTIGMIGLVGSPKLPDTSVMWDGPRVGQVYYSTYYESGIKISKQNNTIEDVECIDGFLIATQVDIPWRDDLFKGWDFYDISESFEMRNAGYRVVVPEQGDEPWCMHDDAFMHLENYNDSRQIFIKNYVKDMMDIPFSKSISLAYTRSEYTEKKNVINELLKDHTRQSYECIIEYLDDDKWFAPVRETDEFAALKLMASIYCSENNNHVTTTVLDRMNSLIDIKNVLFELRMLLYRVCFLYEDTSEIGGADLLQDIYDFWNKYPSKELLWKGLSGLVPNSKSVANRLVDVFEKLSMEEVALQILLYINTIWPGNIGILLKLADIYNRLENGNSVYAREYLSQIPEEFWKLTPEQQQRLLV